MDMRGVLDRFGATEAAQRAVAAGADVLIQPQDARATIDAIVRGVEARKYPAARVADAARRILTAKAQLGLLQRSAFDASAISAVVGTRDNRMLADTIAARAFTLVRDARSAVPLRVRARVLSVTVARRPDLLAGTAFDAALRGGGHVVRSVFVDADAGTAADYAAIRRLADSVDAVVVGSYVATRWDAATIGQSRTFVDFIRGLSTSPRPPVVIAFGNPYLLQQIPDVPAYAVAWNGGAPAQGAAARGLMGRAAIAGRLPISIPPVATKGAGIQKPASR
jgi:beta-N-acetylhexosaminidase